MSDDDKKKHKPKSIHPFDVWPPPPKKDIETEAEEKKPRNTSYKDINEYAEEVVPEVYDLEDETEKKEEEQRQKDEKEEREENEEQKK